MDENLTVFVNRRKKLVTKQELEKCSKEVGLNCLHAHMLLFYFEFNFSFNFLFFFSKELINRVLQLEAHNQQLRNVLKKEMNIDDGSGSGSGTVDNNRKKFDFTK